MNADDSYDTSLALVHIGIILAEWDESLVELPVSLYEVEQRLTALFGVSVQEEQNILRVRDKLEAIIELLDGERRIQ